MAVNSANMVIGGLTVNVTRPTANGGLGIAYDIGGLDASAGATITPAYENYSPDIEQELNPSIFRYLKKTFKAAMTLAEIFIDNMRQAWDLNGAVSTSGAGATLTKTISFGTANTVDFQPAPLVVAITSFVPGPGSVTGSPLFLRTYTLNRAQLDSPGEMKITKKGICTIPLTLNAVYDSASSKVGTIADNVGT